MPILFFRCYLYSYSTRTYFPDPKRFVWIEDTLLSMVLSSASCRYVRSVLLNLFSSYLMTKTR